MGDPFEVDIKGGDALTRLLGQLGPLAIAEGAKSLYRTAEQIMTRSKAEFVPVETGTLKSSGFVRPPEIQGSSVTVVLGYGGPAQGYALYVHENPRAGRTGGVSPKGHPYRRWATTGQWKYLETPAKEAGPQIAANLLADLKTAIAGKK